MAELCIHDLIPSGCAVCNGADVTQRAKRPPAAERHSEAIFDLIPVVADDTDRPISNQKLAAESGLTPAQVAAAVAYMRDNYPELPLVSSSDGYCFTLRSGDINRFRLARMRAALTIIRRLWRGVIKPYVDRRVKNEKMGADQAGFLTMQFEHLLDYLDRMAV
jgi:hypothetical protein